MIGTMRLPSIAVVAIVEPEIALNTVPATTATTASLPGDVFDDTLDSVDDLYRQTGVKKDLAHQDEERNWR